MHVNVFDFSQLLAASNKPYVEFLRVAAFSVGIYVLDGGATDTQKPHTEDEVYYIAGGRARMRIDSEGDAKTFDVCPGTIIFVPARVHHFTRLARGFQFSCSSPQPRVRPFVLRRDKFDLIPEQMGHVRKGKASRAKHGQTPLGGGAY